MERAGSGGEGGVCEGRATERVWPMGGRGLVERVGPVGGDTCIGTLPFSERSQVHQLVFGPWNFSVIKII